MIDDSVSPKTFEKIVETLLRREGFLNVVWVGHSGNDRGVDIECERIEDIGPKSLVRRCAVQCKHLTTLPLRPSRILDDYAQVRIKKYEYFIVATSSVCSPKFRGIFEEIDSPELRVIIWEMCDLEELLFKHQGVRLRYLGIPMDTNYCSVGAFASRNPQLRSLSGVSSTNDLNEILSRAADMVIQDNKMLTVGHLICALAHSENDVFGRALRAANPDLDVENFSKALRKLINDTMDGLSEEDQGGFLLTESFSNTLLAAKRVMDFYQRSLMDELVLAYAILRQGRSESVRLLNTVVKSELKTVLDYIVEVINERYFPRQKPPSPPAFDASGMSTTRLDPTNLELKTGRLVMVDGVMMFKPVGRD